MMLATTTTKTNSKMLSQRFNSDLAPYPDTELYKFIFNPTFHQTLISFQNILICF